MLGTKSTDASMDVAGDGAQYRQSDSAAQHCCPAVLVKSKFEKAK
jgi:hypothetical protein